MSAKDVRDGVAKLPTTRQTRPAKDFAAGGNVGNALRSVYDETVKEDIPGDLLDLLGKLS